MKEPDWDDLAAKLEEEAPDPFTLPANRFYLPGPFSTSRAEIRKRGAAGHKRRAEGKKVAKRAARLTKPENALEVARAMPAPGARMHVLLKGDFVLCDLIGATIDAHGGSAGHVRISTLSMSEKNADALAGWVGQKIHRLSLICSQYFAAVNKATVWRHVSERLKDCARLALARCHCKVILIPTAHGDFVIEGSANLRSSGSLEQIAIFNDSTHHDFHADWIDEVAKEHAL